MSRSHPTRESETGSSELISSRAHHAWHLSSHRLVPEARPQAALSPKAGLEMNLSPFLCHSRYQALLRLPAGRGHRQSGAEKGIILGLQHSPPRREELALPEPFHNFSKGLITGTKC